MMTSSRSVSGGLSMKSNAPRRTASAPVAPVPCPEIITTGASHTALIRSSASKPSMPGILMSRKTTSGDSRSASAIPSGPDGAPMNS